MTDVHHRKKIIQCRRPEFDPGVRKNPWRKELLPIPASSSVWPHCTVMPIKPKLQSLEQRKVYCRAKKGDG